MTRPGSCLLTPPLTWCCDGRSPRWPRSLWRCWPCSTPPRPLRLWRCPWSAPDIRWLVTHRGQEARPHLLRGNSKGDCPQVNFLIGLDAGKNKEYSWGKFVSSNPSLLNIFNLDPWHLLVTNVQGGKWQLSRILEQPAYNLKLLIGCLYP